jgi:2-C-methyl-D-erythritol 4-phosphate cytidylyltransferase/2-C-methyl-D-erythritol 2,4-cyclodiphosphate synthase
MTTAILIVAAGRGSRAGAGAPKQYRSLAGRPVLAHTIAAFAAHPAVGPIQVVIHPNDEVAYRYAAAGFDLRDPVPGGATRQESVRRGLAALARAAPESVLIHDGARPLVARAVIDRVLAALSTSPGAIAALPLADTLKRDAGGGRAVGGIDRSGLWRAQTPQGFRFDAIRAAHEAAAGRDLTDDAAVAELAGIETALVTGDEDNFKITTADDLARAERLMLARLGEVRVGSGFDVHAFARGEARPLMLCGIAVPHEAGLAGHSDADVALHALTDALLGALAEGDIGQHFPPGDPQWKGAPSERFLRFAAGRVAARGGVVSHVDITIICEAPKIAPHRAAMQARVAAILGIEAGRVSVKGTTTEKLGFTGRGEGIAAQATATVRLPFGTGAA